MESPEIDASEIEVKVAKGVVTLSGSVDDRWAKRLAEDIAETVSGVTDVMNQLGVDSGSGQSDTSAARTRGTSEATASKSQPNGRRPATTASR
jgi:hypothetical protein